MTNVEARSTSAEPARTPEMSLRLFGTPVAFLGIVNIDLTDAAKSIHCRKAELLFSFADDRPEELVSVELANGNLPDFLHFMQPAETFSVRLVLEKSAGNKGTTVIVQPMSVDHSMIRTAPAFQFTTKKRNR